MRGLLVVLVGGLALLAPLVYFGEWGIWAFSEPVSSLDWDEAQRGPDHRGRVFSSGGAFNEGAGPAAPASLPLLTILVFVAGAGLALAPQRASADRCPVCARSQSPPEE